MQFDVRDIMGNQVKTVELPESIYGVELNDHVLHLAVKAIQANRRQGTHATKTRSTVNGGGTKQLALKVALSDKVRHNKIIVLDKFALEAYKTKQVVSVLSTLGANKALISDVVTDDKLYKSTRNIHGAAMKSPSELNVEDVLRYENFVVTEKALEALNARLGGQ